MALQLLRDMHDDPDVPVDVASYNAAITACGRYATRLPSGVCEAGSDETAGGERGMLVG